VVESACPVDGNVCLLLIQLHCTKLTKLKQTIKHWTVLSDINSHTSLHLFAILRHVVWSDGLQELNVVVTVVLCHLFTTGFVMTHIDLHFPVESIVQQEVVCHADPVGFHGMALSVVVVPHITLRRNNHTECRAHRLLSSATGSSC
uniref:Uncharacterized protein n=1 Tax=Mastacembelus armatus TaxID=205130 RepID=A0A3Q3KYM2_9TELE